MNYEQNMKFSLDINAYVNQAKYIARLQILLNTHT